MKLKILLFSCLLVSVSAFAGDADSLVTASPVSAIEMYNRGTAALSDKQYAEALEWLSRAAGQGHAMAQNNLGGMYANGLGVAKNEAEAVKWYRKAAEQGHATAQNNLGTMYERGTGVAKDVAEAVKWYRKAAEQGHATAQNNLGTMYERGLGVAKSDTEAADWYRKAAEQGNENGEKNFERISASILAASRFVGKGEIFRDCPDCPELIAIPGKDYALGRYEVTLAEWEAVMGSNPAQSREEKNRPVNDVSWNDVQEYLKRLSQKTGKSYRLPKEEEWEFACLGGNQTDYCGGDDPDAVGWYSDNSGGFYSGQAHPVGRKQANGYGLYDMSGNVEEWMEDCGDAGCTKRAVRGGSWFDGQLFIRADKRSGLPASKRSTHTGFRLARTMP